MSTIEELLAPFVGKAETDAIDVKKAPPRTESLVHKIQGAINADISECLFLIGVEEIEGKIGYQGIVGVDFPITPEGAKRGFETFDRYRLHLMSVLQDSSTPWKSGLVEIAEVLSADGKKTAIAIFVRGGVLVQAKGGDFPIREGTSIRSMTVEEIVSKKTGATPTDLVSVPWEEARTDFRETLPRDRRAGRIIGFYCVAGPVGVQMNVIAPWEDKNESLVLKKHFFTAQLGSDEFTIDAIEGADYGGPLHRQPIQNGVSASWQRHIQPDPFDTNSVAAVDWCTVRLRRNGTISLCTRSTYLSPVPHLNIRWVLCDVLNTLSLIQRVRVFSEQVDATYAIGLELRYDDQLIDSFGPVTMGEWRFCELADEQGRVGKLLPSEPIIFGPYKVGGKDLFSELMRRIYEDIEIAAGRQPNKDLTFESAFGDPVWFPD